MSLISHEIGWRKSPEYRAVRVWQQILLGFTVVGAAVAMVLLLVIASEEASNLPEEAVPPALWIAAAGVTLLSGVSGLTWYAQHGIALRKYEDRRDQERRGRLRESRDREVEPGELSALLAANRDLLDEYQKPVRSQARTSYVYSQVAILAGLVLLLVGGLLIFIGTDTATRVAIAGLAGVGSALSGYVARTYLRIYERAQMQLNFYFREPLITSYLLTAERLAAKLDRDRQQQVYGAMVDQIVEIAKSDAAPISAVDS